MIRNLFRRGVPALLLTLLLAGAAPAAAADWSLLERWDGVWSWLANVWMADESGGGDRGPGADPDGLNTGGDRGPEADPNGQTTEEDRGPELDPNG